VTVLVSSRCEWVADSVSGHARKILNDQGPVTGKPVYVIYLIIARTVIEE